MDCRTLLVDAFTDRTLAGNVAGVVPDASGLSEAQMRAVARELGASETAFVLPSGSADRRLRYFTPATEVDLCGHATVATHAHLHADGVLDAGTHTMETAAGVLDVEVTDDGVVWMTQSSPEVRRVEVDYGRAADALGVPEAALADVGGDLPPAVASTGLPYLILPVAFLEHLGGADPDFAAVEELAAGVDATGVYAFTFDTLDAESTLHGRMFAPGAGVPEDPVTGTASGAAGAYLRHVGAFAGEAPPGAAERTREPVERGLPEEMRFEQGHFVDRPGLVRVRVGTEVRVGGRAVTAMDGTLSVPPVAGDDIIEA
jgi:PhzF family phenazine biosynthesis protein